MLTPTGSPAERFTSRDPDAFESPSTRDEDWRFSPLTKLRAFFEPFDEDLVVEGSTTVPDGAHVDAVDPQTVPAFGSVLTPADRASAIAMKHARKGTHTVIDANAELE